MPTTAATNKPKYLSDDAHEKSRHIFFVKNGTCLILFTILSDMVDFLVKLFYTVLKLIA